MIFTRPVISPGIVTCNVFWSVSTGSSSERLSTPGRPIGSNEKAVLEMRLTETAERDLWQSGGRPPPQGLRRLPCVVHEITGGRCVGRLSAPR